MIRTGRAVPIYCKARALVAEKPIYFFQLINIYCGHILFLGMTRTNKRWALRSRCCGAPHRSFIIIWSMIWTMNGACSSRIWNYITISPNFSFKFCLLIFIPFRKWRFLAIQQFLEKKESSPICIFLIFLVLTHTIISLNS